MQNFTEQGDIIMDKNETYGLRDKNGLTEAEFLSQYNEGDYKRPSLTTDLLIFQQSIEAGKETDPIGNGGCPMLLPETKILLIKRGNHPSLGRWALPGGFVNPDENARAAALRELSEETGIAGGVEPTPFGLYSNPGRDPRGWVISEAFWSCIYGARSAEAGDDAADAAWFSLKAEILNGKAYIQLVHGDACLSINASLKKNPANGNWEAYGLVSDGLAFDHGQIIMDGWLSWNRSKKIRVLFVGNSMAYFNDMPGMMAREAEQSGIECQVAMLASPGASLEGLIHKPETKFNLCYGDYDYVVLNDHAHPPASYAEMRASVEKIQRLLKDSGSLPVLYMPSSLKSDPEGQKELSEIYKKVGVSCKIPVIPVGEHFWEQQISGDEELFGPDGEHPSAAGSLLIASCIWHEIQRMEASKK